MGFNAPPLNTRSTILCPPGTLVARCRMVIDFGKHPQFFQNKPTGREVEKLLFGFEFPTKTHVFDEAKGPEPFTLSIRFNKSSNREKGKLLPMIDSWLGQRVPDDKIEGLRYDKLLNRPALISVVHKPKSPPNQKEMMAIINSITALPEEMKCPPPILPQIAYSVDFGKENPFPVWVYEPDPTDATKVKAIQKMMKFEEFPEWIREDCNKCLNWAPADPDEAPGSSGGGDDSGNDSNNPW